MVKLAHELTKWTAENSRFETSRKYVSISNCVKSVDELVKDYFGGFDDSESIRLRCYKGYQMEYDILRRLKLIFDDRITLNPEISIADGLIQGHPDFLIDGIPGDCKSVPLDEHLPKERLPKKVYWQMQGYMLYTGKDKAVVIYESRETGKIIDWWIRENASIQREIDFKMASVQTEIKRLLK